MPRAATFAAQRSDRAEVVRYSGPERGTDVGSTIGTTPQTSSWTPSTRALAKLSKSEKQIEDAVRPYLLYRPDSHPYSSPQVGLKLRMGDSKEETHCEKCCEALDNPDAGICPSCVAAVESEGDGDADDEWEDTEEEQKTSEPATGAESSPATETDGQEDGEGTTKEQVSPS